MRIALFGGSFDPPHIAHQLVCLYLLEYKQFDKVFLIPAYKHPFNKALIEFNHRYHMCALLTEPFKQNVIATSIEEYLVEECNGKGYTIETVKYYKNNWPDDVFTVIVGTDVLDEMDKWKEFSEINKLAGIVSHPRIAHPMYGQDISSTRIRKLIEWGESIVEWVPTSVLKYIEKNRLYK